MAATAISRHSKDTKGSAHRPVLHKLSQGVFMKVAANPVTGPSWSPPEAPPPPSPAPAPASEGGPSIADRMFGRGAPATPSAPWGKPEFAQSPAAGLAGLAAVNAGTAGLVQAELIQSQGQALLPAAPFAGLAAPQIMGQAMHAIQDRFAQHPQDGRPQGDQESFSDQQGQPQHEPPLSQAALWLALQEPSGVRPIPMPKPRPIEQDSFLSAGALQTQSPIWLGFSDGGQIPSSLPAQDGASFISHPLSSLPLPPQPAQFTGWLKNAPAPDAAAATSATSASHASSPTQTNPAAPAATAPPNAVEGTSAAAPKGPSADRNEIAALEMTLADPANKDMVAHFGGQLEPLPTWTTVGQGIEARYGADLGGRLYQLQKAQRAVEAEFFRAMDESRKDPPKDAAPRLQRPDQPAPTTDKPGWHYNPGGGHADAWTPPSWEYSPELFAQQYAKGESAAQKALASMYGPEPLKYAPGADTEVGSPGGIQLDGLRLREPRGYGGVEEGLTPDSLHVRDGWVQSGVTPPDHYLDPNRITKLNNNEFVWFDPVRGFMTDPDNLKESGLDKAFPYIMAAAFAAMGAGAVGGAVMNATGSAVAQGAAAGATGSLLGQYVATGHVNFKSVLTSALAGGLTAGVMEIPGARENLTGASSTVGKLIQATGRATIQGAIQGIIGGKFKDGFINSMLASAAQEVGDLINAEIGKIPNLTESERGAMRLLSRATTSAMRMVGSNDPAAGFASDFLSGVVGDAVASQVPANQQASGASTEQGAEAIAASPDGDRVDVAMPAAGEHSAGEGSGLGASSDSDSVFGASVDESHASRVAQLQTQADSELNAPLRIEVSGTGWTDHTVQSDGTVLSRPRDGSDEPDLRMLSNVPTGGAAPTIFGYEPIDDRVFSDGTREILYRPQSGPALNNFLQEIATRTAGAVGGTADSFSGMVQDTWRWGSNSAIQVGDLLTFGYNHDHPRVQEAWSEQEQLGRSIVNMMLNPRDAASAGFESVVNRYNAAMSLSDPSEQSRALGHLFNDVGQTAVGMGVTAGSLVKPAASAVDAIGGRLARVNNESGKARIAELAAQIEKQNFYRDGWTPDVASPQTLAVASRTIIWPLVKQMRMGLMPVFHCLQRRLALQG